MEGLVGARRSIIGLLGKVAAGLLFVTFVVAGLFFYIFYGGNSFDVDKKAFFVSKGQTWSQVVDSLEANGIIRNKEWFIFVTRVLNKGTRTHVGKYVFESGISNVELYDALRLGRDIVPIAVTFGEGRRATSFARAARRMLGADSARFIDLVHDREFARSLGVDASTLEGYLSPNTYFFHWQTDEQDIIVRLVRQTEKVFDDSLLARARKLRMSVHQVLTLASIIEAEAFLSDERPTIAGVYYNRLRKGMRLEADPTIQFLMSDGPRRVLYRDLRVSSPYNTYLHYGLPPGPINNPSKGSIVAALFPEKHEYLFFVADGKGGHWFARNYAEHMTNVRKFRAIRSQQQEGG